MTTQASPSIVRIEPPRAAGAVGIWETSHEFLIPDGGPWAHVTVVLVVSARDADSDEVGEYRLLNVTQNTETATTAFGLAEDLRLVLDSPTAGDLLHIQRRPGTASADAWVIEAAATLHDQALGATTAPDLGPPPAVTITAEAGDGQVSLTWPLPPHDVDLTEIRMRESPTGTWVTVFTGTVNGSISIAGTIIVNGTTYDFEVRLRNSHGAGPWSNTATVTPQPPSGAVYGTAVYGTDTY